MDSARAEIEADGFADFEPNVIRKLEAEIRGTTGGILPIAATLRFTSISVIRTHGNDVGKRLARLRSGIPVAMNQPAAVPAVTDAKGGMAKGVIVPAAVPRRWEVYGTGFYFMEEGDRQFITRGGGLAAPALLMVSPDYDLDIWGGNVGVEYRLNENWTVGGAIGASYSDISMNLIGSADIDSYAIMPYVSYVRPEVFAGATYYADLLFGYSSQSYDTRRLTGAIGSTDGDATTLEFTTGLNMQAGGVATSDRVFRNFHLAPLRIIRTTGPPVRHLP